ncbi:MULTISPECIES: hypothetical protein [Aeromonas]|uniref:hypothetical protein n=1 Tax=Aeromonas TaxID=642 RepID=UPI001BCC6297|nr:MULTISPECIES: hypothetical protein [Aeromonas]MBS4725139.1 hypothetical protein [Aeromonas veronii]MDK3164167.1 hypothetical protein [Aeromonas caviae]
MNMTVQVRDTAEITNEPIGSCWLWHRWLRVRVFAGVEYLMCSDCNARKALMRRPGVVDVQLTWILGHSDQLLLGADLKAPAKPPRKP